MQKQSLYLFIGCMLVVNFTAAQNDPELRQALRNKTDLAAIMQTVKEFYRRPATMARLGATTIRRDLKHWQRWEWYMSGRLGPQGRFVNINQKLREATGVQQKRMTNNNARTGEAQSVTGSWVLIGPVNTTAGIGRVDRLAFHPTNANTVYAGSTAGGLWRTTDAGANWTNLTPDISSAGISGIIIDPDNTNTIYILTGDGDSDIGGLVDDYGYMRLSIGVLKSTDGGSNWRRLGDFPGADYSTLVGYRLVMHPTNHNILYACTSQGLYWSVNSGETWGLLKGGSRFFNLVFRPGSGNICYAVGSSTFFGRANFWRSTTSGFVIDTIPAINNQINNPTRRCEIAVTPADPDLVYLLAGGVSVAGQFKGLYQSPDGGLTFNLQSNTPNIVGRANDGSDAAQQSNYDLALAVSNTGSNTVIAGAIEAWRSLNSGSTWAFRGNLHDDVHDLGFHPVDNKLWAATDGGVYSSTDNGFNWTSHYADMSVSQFYRMAVSPGDYLEMIAGSQDNGVKKRSNGTTFFDDISGSDAFAVGYDFAEDSIYYAVLNQSINKFTANGASNFSITPPNTNNPFSMSMAVHTSLGDALFIGSDSIWRTTNGGTSWNVSSVNGGWFLRTCPSNGNRVYAAGGTAYNAASGILRRSDNAGASWGNILSNNPGFPTSYTKITSINVDPSNSLNVWVTIGGFDAGVKVYSSTDGGENWVNRSGTLPNVPVNCIALDSDNNAYVGTDNGVYYRSTGMSDWIPFYNNLPYVPVTDLVISEAENLIRAATFGRGIWSSTLRSACLDYQNVLGTLEGQEFYETADSISSSAVLKNSEGTKVQLRAGLQVRLLPGFSAYENTAFRALIGPCGGGGVAGFRMSGTSKEPLPKKLFKAAGKRKALLHIKPGNGIATQVTVLEAGKLLFVLTGADGSPIQSWENGFVQKGRTEITLSNKLQTSKRGSYHLHLFHNGEWQHFQEVEVN